MHAHRARRLTCVGGFLWPPTLRIDIQLQDGRDGLQYVEIKSDAPRPPCARLLTAFGQDTRPLMVQLVLEGVFLSVGTWLDLLEP